MKISQQNDGIIMTMKTAEKRYRFRGMM